MSHNTFGHLLRVTTWGESHGPALGCVVDGCPPGIRIEAAEIQHWLDRRKPGTSRFVTQRREADEVKILSGVFSDGRSGAQVTTGTPISLLIENTDQRSRDYSDIAASFRPGHADYPYFAKYGVRDYRGGGRSSARETAARVAAGAVARKILGEGVNIRAALVKIGKLGVDRARWDWAETENNPFWSPDAEAAARWEAYLDEMRMRQDGPTFLSNHAGGILGGISTGQTLIARVAFKPTSSIPTPRLSLNEAGEEIEVRTTGRHDPCVAIRAAPVVEAMTACVLADAFLRHRGQTGGGAFVPGQEGRR